MAPVFVSNRGTRINTGALQGQQLQRVQNLANTGYGTKAAQVSRTLNMRIPATTSPGTTSTPGVPPTGGTDGVLNTQNAPVNGVARSGQQQNNRASWALPTDLSTLQAQRQHIAAGIADRQAQGIHSPQDNARLAKIDAAIAGQNTTTGTVDTTTGTADTGTTGTSTNTSGLPDGLSEDFLKSLFPQYDQNSDAYKWQVQQGEDQLDKSLAARGLVNSGKAIRDELNIPLQVGAESTDRMLSNNQTNAARIAQMQENESNRKYNVGNDTWNHVMDIAKLQADQSPWGQAVAALNNSANVMQMSGKEKANFLAQAYRHFGGGRSRGGHPQISVPGSPDFSNITPSQISGNASSDNGWTNLAQNVLMSLFPSLSSATR